MISLFRKLRQEGGSSRYLRYALGEILLVVVGILIALQINNWNEGRKQDRADQEFLKNLRIELSLDIATFERKTKEFRDINDRVDAAFRLLESTKPASRGELDSLSVALAIFSRLTPFVKNVSRNDEFIGQGRLEAIDMELNRNYLTYLDNINAGATLGTKLGDALKLIEINQFHPKVGFNYISPSPADSVDIEFDLGELRTDLTIKNGLTKSVFWRGVYVRAVQGQINEANRLISRIDSLLAVN